MNARTAIAIPAYNEEASIGALLDELCAILPDVPVFVVDDGSADGTAAVAQSRGATVLRLPCNLGVGGAVQTALAHIRTAGFETIVRIDGDGQHNPADVARLVSALDESCADIAIGSRFLSQSGAPASSTRWRMLGNRLLARFLSAICRCRITDPTSGFWAMRGRVLDYFAKNFPCEYPEPEAIALARRQGYEIVETAIAVRPREHGVSHIGSIGTLYFALRVGLALIADRVRTVDRRFAKNNIHGGQS